MKSIVLTLTVLFAVVVPGDVVPLVTQQGYFIEDGADATEAVVGDAVAEARFSGGALSVVVLSHEPTSGATTFADAVLDGLSTSQGTVLVVATQTVGWSSVGDIWTREQLDTALDASLSGSSSDDVVEIFVAELVTPSDGSSSADSGSSGVPIFLIIFALIVAGFVFFVWRASRRQRAAAAGRVEDLRAAAQQRIDAIANDILDLEDEVREANNTDAKEHFEAAVATYTAAADRLKAMTSGKEIAEFSFELDTAVWHLDAAEALLDGNPAPDKPEPPVLEVPEPAGPASAPVPTDTPKMPDMVPEYHRRPQRRSSYGAAEVMAAVLAAQTMGRGGRRSGGRRSGGAPSTPRMPRMRGGGRRRG